MDCHFLLQGIFPTQESNPGLPRCRQTLYRLSHQGSPKDLPKCCWYPGHLDELDYLSISLGLKSKATKQMNLPFLVLFQANSSSCPELQKELLTISGQKDGSCLMIMTHIHYGVSVMVQGRPMTNFLSLKKGTLWKLVFDEAWKKLRGH